MSEFGHDWREIDEVHFEHLESLQREGAVYTDHWQDHLNDFRHVRIRLSDDEIQEYVRRLWALELFLRAGSPSSAKGVAEIPADVADDADSYVMHTADGETIGPPFHCAAAFFGNHLENVFCSNDRAEVLEESGTQALITTVKRAIDALTPSIRLFSRREKGLVNWPITREDDIRDLLYAILRASVSDIQREEAVPSRAGTHRYVDLCSKVARLFIEVKWIHKRGTWRQIVKQINDDTQSYVAHPSCVTLVFVVIDAAKDIPDPASFGKDLTGPQKIDDKTIDVYTFVREP